MKNPEICHTMIEYGPDRRNGENASQAVAPFAEASSSRLQSDNDLDHALKDALRSENEDYWEDWRSEGCSATLRRRWKD
jgi:hypothetical protein